MDDDEDTPTWLAAPCPPWCRRTHREHDHPEDRLHQGEGTVLPVVLGRLDAARLRYVPRASELVVRLVRDLPAAAPTWVVVAESEGAGTPLVLSWESAGLLRAALPREE